MSRSHFARFLREHASLLLLLAAFLLTGLNSISNKAIHPLGLDDCMGLYSLGFWGSGVVLGLITIAITKHGARKLDAGIGIVMGVSGAIGMVLLLIALKTVPGVVAFPVRSCGNTSLTAIVSFIAWREKVTPRQWLGIICGLAAIYLLLPVH
jgi:drug/metabolite transporter (DMT)-like permease